MILLIIILTILIVWKIFSSSSNEIKKTGEWSYTPEDIGKSGERAVARKLNRLPKEYIVLNDVLLCTPYGTTQIDHIVVSPYAIFVIETKNYKGWIFGHQDAEEWKQSLFGQKQMSRWSSNQYKFINPIRQNMVHFQAVKTVLREIGDFTIIPIVAFADSANLKITTPNHTVINWCDLQSFIMSYKTPSISLDKIQQIVTKLSVSNIVIEGSRERHVERVQMMQQNRELAIANRRCPKCGGLLVQRQSKYGSFLGCSNYPRCRFTHNN